ncbi:muts domain V-domain-containing protein [Ochromonadaceae sp. CCMP2298]|nr:muts domain V-domain-containing protein [Ochromonadaceae sp. CCMP2298]
MTTSSSVFRTLEADSSKEDLRTFYFFKRDWAYVSHGSQAVALAEAFYKTTSVIKYEQGLETLEVGAKLFASMMSTILEKRMGVAIWHKPTAAASCPWVRWKDASPGNLAEVEDMLPEYLGADARVSAPYMAAMAVTEVKGTVVVGLSLLSTSLGIIALFDVFDLSSMGLLESTLAQYEVAECLVANTGTAPSTPTLHSSIRRILDRNNVAVRFAADSGEGGPDAVQSSLDAARRAIIVRQLQHLSKSEAQESKGTHEDPSANDAEEALVDLQALHANTLLSVEQLLRQLQLWGSPAAAHSFTIQSGKAEQFLEYDIGVAQALSLFPTSSRPAPVPTPASATEEGAGGVDGEQEGPRVEAIGSVFELLNQTKTSMGARLLKQRLLRPLRNAGMIKARQDCVQVLLRDVSMLEALREMPENLLRFPDMDKLGLKLTRDLSRVTLSDLLAIYRCVLRVKSIAQQLAAADPPDVATAPGVMGFVQMAEELQQSSVGFDNFIALVEEVVDVSRMAAGRGGEGALWNDRWLRVRPDFDPELQRLHAALDVLQTSMGAELRRVVGAAKADAKTVLVENSDVHGPHFRVTKKQSTKVLKALQGAKVGVTVLSTQKAGTLFVTEPMRSLAARFTQTKDAYSSVQAAVLLNAAQVAATYTKLVRSTAYLVAEVDFHAALANVALVHDWCKPTLVDPYDAHADSTAMTSSGGGLGGLRSAGGAGSPPSIDILQLVHPLLKAKIGSTEYIPSDLHMGPLTRLCVLTGPNMGGKSTFMRALGICVILAHMGSHVPAEAAVLPLTDRVFARVGASDCSELGVSTYLAECLETQNILQHATRSSLVLIDELGRGTSTTDGFGVAWAVLSALLERNRCLTLCATHFHELTAMESALGNAVDRAADTSGACDVDRTGQEGGDVDCGVVNLHAAAAVDEARRSITMLYQIQRGPATRSYGIHVAKIAQFPSQIVDEARRIEGALEGAQRRADALRAGAEGLHGEGGSDGAGIVRTGSAGSAGTGGGGDGGGGGGKRRRLEQEDLVGELRKLLQEAKQYCQ